MAAKTVGWTPPEIYGYRTYFMMLRHEYETMRGIEDTHWWYRTLRRRVINDLRTLLRDLPAASILDDGCGTGGMLEAIRVKGEPGWQTHGIDLSPEGVAFCRERGLPSVIEGDVCELPFGSDTFDAVLSLDVLLCRAVDEGRALAEAVRVLRPGGGVIVNLAAFECLRGSHDTAVQAVRRYTPWGLKSLLREHGLTVSLIHAWNAWAFLPMLMWRQLSRLGSQPEAENTKSDLFGFPEPVNSALSWLSGADMGVCRLLRFPLGSSVYAVCRKK